MLKKNVCLLLLIFYSPKILIGQSKSYSTFLKYLNNASFSSDKIRNIPTSIDGNGDIYIAGVNGTSNKNIVVQKLNPKGFLLWEYIFDSDSQDDDWPSDIQTDDNGNIYVCGSTISKSQTKQDGILLKIKPNGTLDWKYSSNFSTSFYHFTKISLNKQQSKVFLAGNITSSVYIDHLLDPVLKNNQDTIYTQGVSELIKSNGSFFYKAFFNVNEKSYLSQVSVSNNVAFSSGVVWDNIGNERIRIESYSLNTTNTIWTKDFPSKSIAKPNCMEVIGPNLFIGGTSDLLNQGNSDFTILKFNKNNGALQWCYTLNGINNTQDYVKNIIIENNEIFACGEVNNNVALVKLNQNGIESNFCKDYKTLTKVKNLELKQNIIGVKNCQDLNYTRELEVYKQSEKSYLFIPDAKKEESFAKQSIVWSGQEINVYPNPSISDISIDFLGFKGKNASISISNYLGQYMVKDMKINIEKTFKINISDYPKGNYFIEVYQSSTNRAGFHFVKL